MTEDKWIFGYPFAFGVQYWTGGAYDSDPNKAQIFTKQEAENFLGQTAVSMAFFIKPLESCLHDYKLGKTNNFVKL